jgi:hypothetical protein
MNSAICRLSWRVIATLFVVVLGPATARAQVEDETEEPTNPAVEQIQDLNQQAQEAFKTYAFRKAERALQEALELSQRSSLGAHPDIAETYVLLGVSAVSGSNDLYRGLHYFVRALRMNPESAVPLDLATPQLLQMFKKAKRTVKLVENPPEIDIGRVQKEGTGDDAPVKKTGRGLKHVLIDTAKRGYPVPVKATPGLDIQAHRVFLYYRPEGKVKFEKVPMRKSKGTFRGEIPAKITRGRYLHYYIEAVDQRGRLAASKGSARSPNVVIISN